MRIFSFLALILLLPSCGLSEDSPSSLPTVKHSTATPRYSPAGWGPDPSPGPRIQVQVARALDGDTLELRDGRLVRYIGVNIPESLAPAKSAECFGEEARARNRELVEGKTVLLEKDISETDNAGRLLRYVYLQDERMVNEVLLAEGYAQLGISEPDVKYQQRLARAQRQARDAQLGLWDTQCGQPRMIPTPSGGRRD